MDGIHHDLRVDSAHAASANGTSERAAYWRMWQMAQSPDYEPDEVVSLIMQHQNIADRMLRVTNSLAAGIKREITNVRHAVLMIGSRGVTEFAQPMARHYAATLEARSLRTDAPEASAPMGAAIKTPTREAVQAANRS